MKANQNCKTNTGEYQKKIPDREIATADLAWDEEKKRNEFRWSR